MQNGGSFKISELSNERELPAGKGFADLVFKPRKNCHSPALIVELKYDNYN